MIKEFVERFDARREDLRQEFLHKHPDGWRGLVTTVISYLGGDEWFESGEYEINPDPERIYVIDNGTYQGTLVFVIANKGYSPSEYFYCKIAYGSCSACDTFLSIRDKVTGNDNDFPDEQQASDYLTLALHIVQNLKRMEDSNRD